MFLILMFLLFLTGFAFLGLGYGKIGAKIVCLTLFCSIYMYFHIVFHVSAVSFLLGIFSLPLMGMCLYGLMPYSKKDDSFLENQENNTNRISF